MKSCLIVPFPANNPLQNKTITDADLVQRAWEARNLASAPYSNYKVGAALLTRSGKVYTGANVESSSYGLSCCAERVTLFKALNEGETEFSTIAVVAEGSLTPVPCGACRQLLADYAKNITILLSSKRERFESVPLSNLFPRPFTAEFLK
jgi:cytidine deaminase